MKKMSNAKRIGLICIALVFVLGVVAFAIFYQTPVAFAQADDGDRAVPAQAAFVPEPLPADAIVNPNRDLRVQNIRPTGIADSNNAIFGITMVNEETNLNDFIHFLHGRDGSLNPADPLRRYFNEDFHPHNKRWNGIPSVVRVGDNIFVAYYTGGHIEPHPDNYIVIAASPDAGDTWINPWMVITGNPRGVVWPLFYHNALGELLMLYGDNRMTGAQTIRFYNAGGPLEDVRVSNPWVTTVPMAISCRPIILSDGSLLAAYGTNDTMVIRSTDNGRTFQDRATIRRSDGVCDAREPWAEVAILEKTCGTLWALRRLEQGRGIEQAFSTNQGRNWTRATNDMPIPPFFSPGSRFKLTRLESGNLLFATNMMGRGTDRRRMTVWLSEDDGESWPYSLELDPTQSSYPDFFQGPDGMIYLAHDRERYGEGGIRLHMFREEDVKKGEFHTAGSRQGIIVTKRDNSFGDIVCVGGAFERVETFPFGTPLATILADRPTTITVTDDNGAEHTITGRYTVPGFNANVPGRYFAYFSPNPPLPRTLKDGFNNLRFSVIIQAAEGGGCTQGSVGAALLSATLALAVAFFIKRKS